jgi:hypothetical protein
MECKLVKEIDPEIQLSLSHENKDTLIKTVCINGFCTSFKG